tara:strand:- start:37320 stop:38111 length:792 start_codon:yes stop_codon:yes gene_type:complete
MRTLFYILSFVIVANSCQKVIDVDLNESNSKVVIEANYSSEDSTVRLRLSLTSSYFEPSSASELNSATVSILDGNGTATFLSNIGNGEYILTNYVPTYNSIYRMNVVYNGVTYSASSELPSPVQLQPITYEFTTGFFGSGEGYFCYQNYDDPIGSENFYISVISKNGFEKNKVNDFILGDDRLTDGNTVSRPLFIDSLFALGDTASIEFRSISEDVFYYYDEIQSIAGGGQSAAPANPLKIWDNDALGYFSAYSNSRQTVIIQ